MGIGGGFNNINLEQLQENLGDNVISNESGVFTFIDNFTIPPDFEIIIDTNEQLIIETGVSVELEGKITLSEAVGAMNPPLLVRGEITSETVGAMNPSLLVRGELTMLEFSEIEINLTESHEIYGGIIEEGIGLYIENGTFNQNGGNITFTSINGDSSVGIFLLNSTFNLNSGDITFGSLTNSATAIKITDSSFTKQSSSSIKVNGDKDLTTFGIHVNGASLITNLGLIDMTNTGTPYTPALSDPLTAPWNSGDSKRTNYLPLS
jgi:hypothetical protein